MKLYTEEQVKVLIDALNDVKFWDDRLEDEYDDAGIRADFALNYFSHSTPIELPSDEEIVEGADDWVFKTPENRWSNNNDEAGDNFGSFIRGAKWMKEQILNQNK